MIAHCHRTAKPFSSRHRNLQRIAHRHSTGRRSSSDRKGSNFSDECQIRELEEAYSP